MMRILLLLVAVIAVTLPEVWLGNLGFALPLTVIPVFFASAQYGWRTGACWAFLAGCWVDLLYGRDFPISLPALLAAVLATWTRQHDRGISDPLEAAVSAWYATAAAELVWTVGVWNSGEMTLPQSVLYLCWQSFIGGIVTCCGFLLLDVISDKLGIIRLSAAPRPMRGSGKRRWSPDGNLH